MSDVVCDCVRDQSDIMHNALRGARIRPSYTVRSVINISNVCEQRKYDGESRRGERRTYVLPFGCVSGIGRRILNPALRSLTGLLLRPASTLTHPLRPPLQNLTQSFRLA